MKKGFTLIEILVVIAILGIIIGLFFPNLNAFRKRARDQRRKADIKAIVEALELYKLNQSLAAYPVSLLITPGAVWGNQPVPTIIYMKAFPSDPLYNANPSSYFYRYYRPDSLKYYVAACLEDGTDPDVKSSPPAGSGFTGCLNSYWYYKSEP